MTARGAVRRAAPMARPILRDRSSVVLPARPIIGLGSLVADTAPAIATRFSARLQPLLRPAISPLAPLLRPAIASLPPLLRQAISPLAPLLARRRVTVGILLAVLVGSGVPALLTTGGRLAAGEAASGFAPAAGVVSPAASPVVGSSVQAALPALLGATGAGPDPLDLIAKGLLVLVLLYITLRVLRRVQGGPAIAGAHLSVIESRTLAAKASLHLVAIGDRRLVVGLTPAGMVALADLDAAGLAAAFPVPQTLRIRAARTDRHSISRTLGARPVTGS